MQILFYICSIISVHTQELHLLRHPGKSIPIPARMVKNHIIHRRIDQIIQIAAVTQSQTEGHILKSDDPPESPAHK